MIAPNLVDFMEMIRNLEAEGFGEVSSLAQASALCRIDDASRKLPGISLGRLAQLELVTVPTMSKLVKSLEERGLVEKKTDPRDSRAVIVSSTEAGKAAARRARGIFSTRYRSFA